MMARQNAAGAAQEKTRLTAELMLTLSRREKP
jgi:hypothetical protein